MKNNGRDELWDSATWADVDKAVGEEVKRSRVARKVFHTEDVSSANSTPPSWVSTAQIGNPPGTNVLLIPEAPAEPFVEIAVPFWLTPAQVDAESTQHTARALARIAARRLATAEDNIIFHGDFWAPPAGTIVTNGPPTRGLADPFAAVGIAAGGGRAQNLLGAVTSASTNMAGAGWPEPHALILGAGLYEDSLSRLQAGSEETAADRLEHRLQHHLISAALPPRSALLVSLAGDPTTIYTAHEASTAFTGETGDGAYCRFRVFERFQYATRDVASITFLV
jgi:uncharacterized linocin/CFP29 family protein